MQRALGIILLGGVVVLGALYPLFDAAATHAVHQIPTVTIISATSISSTQATLTALINPNNSLTFAWYEWGTSTSFGQATEVRYAGARSTTHKFVMKASHLEPNRLYFFRAVAQNESGTTRSNTLSFRTIEGFALQDSTSSSVIISPPITFFPDGRPSVSTLSPFFVSQHSTLLRGSVNSNGLVTTAWFEWGTTTSFGNTSTLQPVGSVVSSVQYSFALSGLSSNTLYYYRAVANNRNGTAHGSTLSFTTSSLSSPAISQPSSPSSPAPKATTPIKKADDLELSSSLNNAAPWPGSKITYSVTYKNVSADMLTDLTAAVILPTEVDYVSSKLDIHSQEKNTLTFKLGSLKAKRGDELALKVKVDKSSEIGSLLKFKTTVTYRDGLGRLQSVDTSIDATIVRASATPNLLALLFENVDILTILGWLIAFLITSLLLFGGYVGVQKIRNTLRKE